MLTPHVSLREPLLVEKAALPESDTPENDNYSVNCEIVLPLRHARHWLEDLFADFRYHDLLATMAHDFPALLREALDLKRQLGRADNRQDRSHWDLPSIAPEEEDTFSADWTVLISLTRDAWRTVAKRTPDRARLIASEWTQTPYPLFRRLAFFAATHTDVIPPDLGLRWLLMDEHWWLWSTETRRESMRLLVALTRHLDAPHKRRLEEAIIEGPPVPFRDDDGQAEYDVWLRLAKMDAETSSLGEKAQAKLRELGATHPSWQLSDDQREEFSFWISPVGDVVQSKTLVALPSDFSELLDWLRQDPSADIVHHSDWRRRCETDLPGVAAALAELAPVGIWPEHAWYVALQAWAEEELAMVSWLKLAPIVIAMPKELFPSLVVQVGRWVQSVAKATQGISDTIEHLAVFDDLCERVLRVARVPDESDDGGDPVTQALNHPIGYVTEALLRRIYRGSVVDGQGLPNRPRTLFEEMCDTRSRKFRHGRTWLAVYVIALFRVEMEWTTEHVLPLFDWNRSNTEARGAWMAFLWSPRLYPPLMRLKKRSFLETATHYGELDRHKGQYASFLTIVALNKGDMFSERELKEATSRLPDDGLERVVWTLVQTLDSSEGRYTECWRNQIHPYLESVWPRNIERQTPRISARLASLCVTAHDAFPEAVAYLLPQLEPLEVPELMTRKLSGTELCQEFPKHALDFLHAIVKENPVFTPSKLGECLQQIRDADPSLEENDRYRQLIEYGSR